MSRFLLFVLFAVLMSSPTLAERRVALVMGADDYEFVRPLGNAVNDARGVEKALELLGFEVLLETDRDLKRMRRALEDFREEAAGADVALVFFAGHGVEIAGQNRLLPVDAEVATLARLNETTLPLEEVRAAVAEVGKVGLILLDACRNDPFGLTPEAGRGAVSIGADVVNAAAPGLGRMGRAENILFVFSAAPGETAADGAAENSPFTAALIRFLGTDGLEIRSVMTLVQQEVYDLSRGAQLPYVESGLPELFFASTEKDELPERERLLLAMADVTPTLRAEVERIAAERGMPLAPLYAALISQGPDAGGPEGHGGILVEAADAYVKVAAEMRALSSSDPEVARLREEAQRLLSLGSFDTARSRLAEAALVDNASRQALRANYDERTLSEAQTYAASAGAAIAALDYRNAVLDFERALALHDELGAETAGTDDVVAERISMLETLGKVRRRMGDADGAGEAFSAIVEIGGSAVAAGSTDQLVRYGVAIGHEQLAALLVEKGDAAGAMTSLEAALQLARQLDAEERRVTGFAAMIASLQRRIGNIRRAQGDLDGAFAAYSGALGTIRALSARFPKDRSIILDLVDYQTSLAGLLSEQGNFPGALLSINEALAAVDAMAALHPDEEGWQRRAIGLHRLRGELQASYGSLDAARAAYEAARSIVDRLSAKSPMDLDLRRLQAATWIDIGELDERTGSLAEAEKAYQRARSTMWHLVSAYPGNLDWQADLAMLHDHIGDVLDERGDVEGAAAEFEKAWEIRERLVAGDPADLSRRDHLAVSYGRLGRVRLGQGDIDGASDCFERQVEIAADLVARVPQNVSYLSGLAYALGNLGAARRMHGMIGEAEEAYAGAVDAGQRARALSPANTEVKSGLLRSYLQLGWIREMGDRLAPALESYRAAVALAEELVAADPGRLQARLDLAEAHRRVGDVFLAQNDVEGLKKAILDDYAIVSDLKTTYPEHREVNLSFAESLGRIGVLLYSAGKSTEAAQYFESSAKIFARMADADRSDLDTQFSFAATMFQVAEARQLEGRFDAARAAFRGGAAVVEKLVAAQPHNTEWPWRLAEAYWWFAEAGNEPVENYARAVRIAADLDAGGRLSERRRQWLDTARDKLAEAGGSGGG